MKKPICIVCGREAKNCKHNRPLTITNTTTSGHPRTQLMMSFAAMIKESKK